MPGTLMYECCLHTLRVFLMRMGWIGEASQVVCQPVPGVASQLKCRGQVLASTRKATYEISIKEIGYRPEPYVIVDALMYSDAKAIVEITNMSLRMTGLDRETLEGMWLVTEQSVSASAEKKPAIYDYEQILAFAIGKPSEAFGDRYRVFDEERTIARLPGPPYQFLDRITAVEGEPWKMAAGAFAEGQYDVPPDAWYFEAARQPLMPFAVLLEVALQPCGWLAAYCGSALTSPVDLSFRNLGGSAVQYLPIGPDAGTLTMTARMTRVSSSGGMIIQNFDFEVWRGKELAYAGDTYFGFFSKQALADQVGIRDAKRYEPSAAELASSTGRVYPPDFPYPAPMLRMIDDVEIFLPSGGPAGLGYIRGTKRVDPAEWFFKAHFYQDPVCPGSLGLESFLQLVQFAGNERWGIELEKSEPWFWSPRFDTKHRWSYRGQVIPTNRLVTVEAWITAVDDATRTITADGFLLADGKPIYQMNDFSLQRSAYPTAKARKGSKR
jgi:3-hydroxymyristoyl/3-hydroxydecanoyl-(acyl carrier protein) dehydratase